MMRLFLVGLLFVAVGCASSQNSSDVPSDITEATSDTTPASGAPPSDKSAVPGKATNETAANETSEQDLQGNPMADTPGQQTPPAPQASNEVIPPPDQAPAIDSPAPSPDAPTPPPPAVETPAMEAPAGEPAVVTGLDFKGNVNGGTIVIRTNKLVQYTTRRNDKANQFVVELKNTSVPARFRRPYDTKEFPGPIAAINAYQSSGSHDGRIVVQLRDNVEPSINQDGNVISVAGAGTGATPPATADQSPPDELKVEAKNGLSPHEDDTTEDDETSTSTSTTTTKDMQTINNRTLADFLTGNTKFTGRPISIEVKDQDIRDVFRFISEETGLNMVVGDDVTGKTTLKLRKIPWDQALSIVMQSKQLGYVKQGNVLRIATLATLQAESEAARKVIDSQRQLQPLHVQVFPISYAKAQDLQAQATDFLSPRGKTKADPRTNNLVVTDIDENLDRIRQLVKRLDTQTPQVLIEAKIVEARESFERVIGVNWSASGDYLPIGTNSNNGSAMTFNPTFNSAPPGGASSSYLAAGFNISNMDILGNLSATLSLLESESLVKVISAPRIITLDRVEADIQQTTQFPVFSVTPGPTGVPIATVTFQDVRLELDVTPQITMDGSIIMTVKVIREFPDAQTVVGSSAARAINKRQANTQVLVENGDTVVIGGIYQSDVTEGETGVPWLSKVPIIGALFRTRNTSRDKNELVIFLTPRTLNREKAFLSAGDKG